MAFSAMAFNRHRYLLPILVVTLVLAACVASAPAPSRDEPSTAGEPVAAAEDDHNHSAATAPAELPVLAAVDLGNGDKLQVVATTNIVADVVSQVAGDRIDLYAMLPAGADPHSYQPTPQDLRALTDADVVFINGLGLEEAMASTLDQFAAKTVVVNTGVETIEFVAAEHEDEGEAHQHEGADPHTWFSVHAVETWTHNIAHILGALDPAQADAYTATAEAYVEQLAALETELEALVAQVPVAERKLVTDHDSLGYLAAAYDFQVIGSVIPSFSTLAEPSAQQLAQLQEQIRAEGVKAIFVDSTVNPQQETQLARDLGIPVILTYNGSLSAADGPAATYLDFMRYNVGVIVEALGNRDWGMGNGD